MANSILVPGYYFYDGQKVVLVETVQTTPAGTAGGDLSGTFPAPQVNNLTIANQEQGSILFYNGVNWIQLAPDIDGYVLNTHSTGNNPTWELALPKGPAGGDLGGTYPNPEVNDLTIENEEQGSLLYYDGYNWAQLSPEIDGYVLITNGIGENPTWTNSISVKILQPEGLHINHVSGGTLTIDWTRHKYIVDVNSNITALRFSSPPSNDMIMKLYLLNNDGYTIDIDNTTNVDTTNGTFYWISTTDFSAPVSLNNLNSLTIEAVKNLDGGSSNTFFYVLTFSDNIVTA